ncbi:MAG: hypothetical protein ACI8Y4_001281 [Candidatus Poriferisodalaceae bacterium]
MTAEVADGTISLNGSVADQTQRAVLLAADLNTSTVANVDVVETAAQRLERSLANHRDLSAERAASVVAHLIDQGVSADRLLAVGYGPDQPVADKPTADGRSQNRRVQATALTSF